MLPAYLVLSFVCARTNKRHHHHWVLSSAVLRINPTNTTNPTAKFKGTNRGGGHVKGCQSGGGRVEVVGVEGVMRGLSARGLVRGNVDPGCGCL